MGYLKEAVQGIGWMTLSRISYRLIGLGRIVVLARLLAPSDFGLFGIATIVLGFSEILTETGINIFLIQEKENAKKYIDTAWVISIVRGLVISGLILLISTPVSIFFNTPEAKNLLILISFVPLIRGFINPSIVYFQKKLEFKKEFIYRALIFAIEASFSVLFASLTKSAFSLVWGLIIGAIFEVFYTFWVSRPIPKFKFEREKIKEILTRGKWVTGYGIFDYIYTQSDNVVVGKLLGQSLLGIYDNAYTISTSPLTEVGDVFYKVTFPVFSKISGNKTLLLEAFKKNTMVNFVLILPAGIFIYLFADPIVRILLGEGWLLAIPIVKILAVLGIIRGIASSTNSLLISLQKQKYSAITTFISAVTLWVFLVPLVKTYGAPGAAYASIIGTVVSIPFTVYFVHKALKSA